MLISTWKQTEDCGDFFMAINRSEKKNNKIQLFPFCHVIRRSCWRQVKKSCGFPPESSVTSFVIFPLQNSGLDCVLSSYITVNNIQDGWVFSIGFHGICLWSKMKLSAKKKNGKYTWYQNKRNVPKTNKQKKNNLTFEICMKHPKTCELNIKKSSTTEQVFYFHNTLNLVWLFLWKRWRINKNLSPLNIFHKTVKQTLTWIEMSYFPLFGKWDVNFSSLLLIRSSYFGRCVRSVNGCISCRVGSAERSAADCQFIKYDDVRSDGLVEQHPAEYG